MDNKPNGDPASPSPCDCDCDACFSTKLPAWAREFYAAGTAGTAGTDHFTIFDSSRPRVNEAEIAPARFVPIPAFDRSIVTPAPPGYSYCRVGWPQHTKRSVCDATINTVFILEIFLDIIFYLNIKESSRAISTVLCVQLENLDYQVWTSVEKIRIFCY